MPSPWRSQERDHNGLRVDQLNTTMTHECKEQLAMTDEVEPMEYQGDELKKLIEELGTIRQSALDVEAEKLPQAEWLDPTYTESARICSTTLPCGGMTCVPCRDDSPRWDSRL